MRNDPRDWSLEYRAQKLDEIVRQKADYQQTFGSPAGERVLDQLRNVCNGNRSCVAIRSDGTVDQAMSFVLEGRREVLIKIEEILAIAPEELFERWYGMPYVSRIGDAFDD